ncbi:hypothetical protein [Nocardia sp. XZ_19_369]|uniref:hypothetical protein n=1 Tax=Nocardia sp. XZ_19_369 TaxID=2769487 RepID=UPI00188EC472|nr:hypothetical protein [Nocardia sp. XZ_19_369]
MTGIAGSAIAAGALLGGLAAAGSASAAPDFDPSNLPSCLELVDPAGNVDQDLENSERFKDGCLGVDIYAPGMTLAQRKAFVNSESPNYHTIIADLNAKFDEAGNPKSGGYPVEPWDK